jgi:hypothetical protein
MNTIFFHNRGYEVSDDGTIWALAYKNTYEKNIKKRLLKPQVNIKNQYVYVSINVNGTSTAMLVHRLVAMAFLKDFDQCLDVDHIDGNRQNNNLKNLRPCTRSKNLCSFRKKTTGTSSVYRGVIFDKKTKMWRAKAQSNKKFYCGGRYKTEKEAALAFNNLAKKLGFNLEALNEIN